MRPVKAYALSAVTSLALCALVLYLHATGALRMWHLALLVTSLALTLSMGLASLMNLRPSMNAGTDLARLIKGLPIPVFDVSEEGSLTALNKTADESLCKGMTFEDLASLDRGNSLKDAFRSAMNGVASDRVEATLRLTNGEARRFLLCVAPATSGLRGRCARVAALDIDKESRLALELQAARLEAKGHQMKLKKTISELEEFALMAVRREQKMAEIRKMFVEDKDA
jgi:hypothetical protein